MDKENVIYTLKWDMIQPLQTEGNPVICSNMDEEAHSGRNFKLA